MTKINSAKRLISILLILSLLSVFALSVNAESINPESRSTQAIYVGVDDDDAQGHSNASSGTWTRVYSSNLRYGEGLITPCNSSKYYDWIFSTGVAGKGNIGVTLSLWLYHPQFNDPAARYYVLTHSYMAQLIGTVNQNTAPAGWTDFPYKNITAYDAGGANACRAFEMKPSTRGSSYTCGADWVEATFYCNH